MNFEAIATNLSTSTRRLSTRLDISQTLIVRHLHAPVNSHELTEIQAQRRVDDRFIRRIDTCHEKLVYFNNPDKQNQWLDPGQMAEPVAKLEPCAI